MGVQRLQESGCSHGDTGRAEPSLDRSIHNQHTDAGLRLSALDDPQQEHLRRRLCRWPAQNFQRRQYVQHHTEELDVDIRPGRQGRCEDSHPTHSKHHRPASRAAEGDDTRDVLDRSVFIHVPTTHTLSPSFSVFGAFPARHSCLLLFWSSSSSFGVNTTAGVILNATNPRWWSDAHSDYYMDDDGTVSNVSLSVLHKWRDPSLV
ncbi:hypothetical protein BLNAU_9988 [Blattamonas nauphoetae]|uniref:Uncharacterized protein n=1 Tax=Blattamonas nauphoetae TaxID=2049346 RepID=A0ABQ9XU98_9EUKA|nr:hypothetical protein BLNAU_9988 [Blattamonas nauphoetae]